MRKSITNITLVVLLAAPIMSLISVIQAERQKAVQVYTLGFPGDGEDENDDTNSGKDTEMGQDGDIILLEKYALLQLPLRLTQHAARQERLFRDHHHEVQTPPPRK